LARLSVIVAMPLWTAVRTSGSAAGVMSVMANAFSCCVKLSMVNPYCTNQVCL
jgi:hypothetical protein